MENTFIILQKQEKCYRRPWRLRIFCISRMKVRTGKKGRKKLDKEDDASDRGGDGDDADRNNVDVLPWQGFVF